MLHLDFARFPELTTPRLVLREVRNADAPAVFALRSDPDTMRFIPRPLAVSLRDAEEHIALQRAERTANRMLTWIMSLHDDPAMIGLVSLLRIQPEHYRTELGYMVLPAHSGKGYASEAIGAVTAHAFVELGFHSIEAVVDPANTGSIKVLERNGFVKEGHFRENCLHNGAFLDSAVYSLLRH